MASSGPGIATFANLAEALPHVDAVVVAAPPREHATLAVRALAAGKHVLVEKPMATSVHGARRLVGEAASRGLILMVGHTFEYSPAVWTLREVIESGELGEIYYIDSARLNLGLYQSDVNVIWDLAPHDISIINYLLRAVPVSVQAWGSRHAQPLQEDVAYLRISYGERGPRAQIHVSWLDPCKVRRMTIVGSRKMAVYNDTADEDRVRIYDKGVTVTVQQDPRNPPMSYRYGGISAPYIPMQEPLSVQDQHFVDCVQSGRRPDSDGESGLAVVRVLAAASTSLRQGVPVAVEPEHPDGSRVTGLHRADMIRASA
jgi:predicted dehydrogenase